MSNSAREAKATGGVIDCDVHTGRGEEALVERLPKHYQERGLTMPSTGGAHSHARGIPEGEDDWAESTPETTTERLLDAHDIDVGIITGRADMFGISAHQERHYAIEVARAHNQWIAEEWLSSDDRFRGSVLVVPQHPEASADLIREYGSRDDFVQIATGFKSKDSYGKPEFWPIYEAAEEVGLPVALHPGAWGGNAPRGSAAGSPTTFLEAHNALAQTYMGQVNSLVLEGVFEEFPGLQFVCAGGGVAWVPHLMWRMDKNWKGLQEQTPWVDKPPSEYVREHVRFTTQPLEKPDNPEQLLQIFEMMHADETLLFSSDFPHRAGDPRQALPEDTPEDLQRRIMYENAEELYDL